MKTRGGNREDGAIMVEAAFYYPIVICLIIFLLLMAVMSMQRYLFQFEAHRIVSVAAKEVAYHGYDKLGVGEDHEIDFKRIPNSEQITKYYESYTERISDIYREAGNLLRAAGVGSVSTAEYAEDLGSSIAERTLIAVGTISEPDINIDTGFFGTSITVTISHKIKAPGVFRFLGYDKEIQIGSSAYSYTMNPGNFVRNVDVAVDLVEYIFEKLGMSEGFNEFKDKTSKVLSKIL